MNTAKRYTVAALATAAVILPLVGVGIAAADEDETASDSSSTSSTDDSNGAADTTYPSTQSPLQGLSALQGTLGEGNDMFLDALNGDNRPDGANGVESEFPPPDPRYVEGPVGGLIVNGPQG